MDTDRLRFLEYFMDCVDSVESGKKGAIAENNRLASAYDPEFYDIVKKHLYNGNERVRIEVVLFFTKMKEVQAMEDIRTVRKKDNDNVSSACLAYIDQMETGSKDIPELLDTLKHRNGQEFVLAANKMGHVGRREDIPELREIYGQVRNEMKTAVRNALENICERYPDLKQKRYLILSEPIFPDEKSFLKFIDNSSVYLDIRYRDNIFEKTQISFETYKNVSNAIRKIQIRLYNEKNNLRYYGKEARDGYKEIEELLIWAAEDLSQKKTVSDGAVDKHHCPKCGSKMIFVNESWVCTECCFRE